MYYEINVTKDGRHFFATDKRSLPTKQAMEKVYKVFVEKFPSKEGYDIFVSKGETRSWFVDMEYLGKENAEQE